MFQIDQFLLKINFLQNWNKTSVHVLTEIDQILVICQTTHWECLICDFPSCNLLKSFQTLITWLKSDDCLIIR
jgi:hypothetical protein